jgi:hypothetical protein
VAPLKNRTRDSFLRDSEVDDSRKEERGKWKFRPVAIPARHLTTRPATDLLRFCPGPGSRRSPATRVTPENSSRARETVIRLRVVQSGNGSLQSLPRAVCSAVGKRFSEVTAVVQAPREGGARNCTGARGGAWKSRSSDSLKGKRLHRFPEKEKGCAGAGQGSHGRATV